MKIVKDKEAVMWYTSNGMSYYGFCLLGRAQIWIRCKKIENKGNFRRNIII